jgi:putative FmdB family regulatory protein
MRIFDFRCAGCGHVFESFVRADDEARACPECGSASVARQPATQMAIRTSHSRRGRTIDLSSKSCPCGCAGSGHAQR